MPSVTFNPRRVTVSVPRGTSLLRAAKLAGVHIETPCGGHGTCRKCKLTVSASGEEVLACLTSALTDLELETVAAETRDNLKILSDGQSIQIDLDPRVKKIVTPKETVISSGGRLLRVAERPAPVLRCLGVAVDIGTTTLVASLVDLETGGELAVASSLNPQALRGQDVLTRIKLGGTPEGLAQLHGDLIRELNALFQQNARRSGTAVTDIYEVVFSGNTTMLYLAVKESPVTLGKFPYPLTMRGDTSVSAAGIGLEIAERGEIYLPPVISAYVGADIVSGLLATRLARQPGVTLFIDIGTNGEMALAVEGRLAATSTAAGPAFEGMNIACGMRAAKGAIELVELDDRGVTINTIAAAPPAGLCGSGLLDAIGELAAHGLIDRHGRLTRDSAAVPPQWREHLISVADKPAFRLAGDVYLSQKDIRHVQLAKSAVRAGVELMLNTRGVTAEQVDRVLIAGSFGYHLRPASLLNLGLLPRDFAGKIEFVGNTAKTGGTGFLLNQPARQEMAALSAQVEVVELANHPDFEKTFVRMMSFPQREAALV
ncbi:MAG: ASKHA domain-containing protein [Verrucomicrobiales bacterium]|jgi:uncharacterized 2Fe-2S/4Fe-4S cluster protein (DUF4445 family)|nr:ASKHA domain-containing protein [Verrucomicrobiales bacterium]